MLLINKRYLFHKTPYIVESWLAAKGLDRMNANDTNAALHSNDFRDLRCKERKQK